MFSYELDVIILMLIFNAVFTAYEMGLATISRARIAIFVNERKKGADAAAFMKAGGLAATLIATFFAWTGLFYGGGFGRDFVACRKLVGLRLGGPRTSRAPAPNDFQPAPGPAGRGFLNSARTF